MKKISTSLCGALAAVALIGTAAPASAATHGYAKKMNFYEDTSYRGHLEARASFDADFGNDKYGSPFVRSFNDGASSLSNRTGRYWKVFRDRNYNGPAVCIKPGSQVANLKTYGIGDWISSTKMYGTSKPSGCSKTL